MASPPESGPAALEETQEVAVDGPSQHPENGQVRVEVDKPQDGKTKKKPKKRSNAAKKRGTGFEGESWSLTMMRWLQHHTLKS